MTTHHEIPEKPPLSRPVAVLALALIALAAILPFAARDNATVQAFSLAFSSIMLEAMPFMLLGTLVGGVVEVFISRERMESLVPRSELRAASVAAVLGIVFPVCECAIVPVVRRLAGKGLPAAAAVAYLLAGPIVNPVVAISTAMAYNFDWRVAAIRLVAGYVIAVAVALVLASAFRRSSLFGPGVSHSHTHSHCHCHCGCGHSHGHADDRLASRVMAVCNHALDDFMATAPYLAAGAAIAALAQTALDRRLFVALGSTHLLSSAAMMLLAVLLNLCSEADAFIAASFRGLVPFSAQMAFLVIGPMFDIKLLLMYRGLFRKGVVPLLVTLVSTLVLIMALCIDLIGTR